MSPHKELKVLDYETFSTDPEAGTRCISNILLILLNNNYNNFNMLY
jgi:hypothetical protein